MLDSKTFFLILRMKVMFEDEWILVLAKPSKLAVQSKNGQDIQSIYPNWEKDIRATHSLSNTGKLTVIDAIYRRRK